MKETMKIPREVLHGLIFGLRAGNRHTQDSPVMPDVWFGFGGSPRDKDTNTPTRMDLLFEPRRGHRPTDLDNALRKAAKAGRTNNGFVGHVAYDEAHVVAKLDLEALIRVALPLSSWWDLHAGRLSGLTVKEIEKVVNRDPVKGVNEVGAWLIRLVGPLLWVRDQDPNGEFKGFPKPADYSAMVVKVLKGLRKPRPQGAKRRATLWSVHRNREAEIAIWSSSPTIKADAAALLFSLECSHLTWAVLDSGIDATHPAFRERTAKGKLKQKKTASRVVATYDFSRLRKLLETRPDKLPKDIGTKRNPAAELRQRLYHGQAVDWEVLEKLLRVDHNAKYKPPTHPHGSHVAGILGADWRREDAGYDAHDEHDMKGVCPDIRLYDLRAFPDGRGDEFSIIAAMQFIRWLNNRARRPVIQGVNLSFAIPHDVANYACGRTPACQEAERLVGSGVVVVAAAGNRGYVNYLTPEGETQAYRNISITDPGNAEAVLTVGATHRNRPHTYGVSYFSSRGPTGDGRVKPDLVAPGEKIKGPTPGPNYETMDGTSMAAPHVSGAAALIMSRHPEFIGDPERIKRVLRETATDLGRERYFQGAGLVDVCRALQSL
jgi:hypothetical protein